MKHWVGFAVSVWFVACSGDKMMDGSPDAGADGNEDAGPSGSVLTHEFPSFDLDVGDEFAQYCLSWTVNNDQALYVNRVKATNKGGWHHSNWIFVRDSAFRGEDGTWECAERSFNELSGGAIGGVLFAQSTQAMEEEQVFPAGAAMRVPPHARIIGTVHLLNSTAERIRDTTITLEIEAIPQDEVESELYPMSFSYTSLSVAPHTVESFAMDCHIRAAQEEQTGPLPSFSFYYALPHYHALATLLELTIVGGEHDGTKVLESNGAVGEAWGTTLNPPIPFGDADSLRLRCVYNNTRDERVRWGIGDQEMCLFLAYIDAPLRFVGSSGPGHPTTTENNVRYNEAVCDLMVLPSI